MVVTWGVGLADEYLAIMKASHVASGRDPKSPGGHLGRTCRKSEVSFGWNKCSLSYLTLTIRKAKLHEKNDIAVIKMYNIYKGIMISILIISVFLCTFLSCRRTTVKTFRFEEGKMLKRCGSVQGTCPVVYTYYDNVNITHNQYHLIVT